MLSATSYVELITINFTRVESNRGLKPIYTGYVVRATDFDNAAGGGKPLSIASKFV